MGARVRGPHGLEPGGCVPSVVERAGRSAACQKKRLGNLTPPGAAIVFFLLLLLLEASLAPPLFSDVGKAEGNVL